MTREELAAIRGRVDAATPGPWVAYTNAPYEAADARPPSGCSVDSRAAENALLGAGRHRDRDGGFYDDSIADDVVMRADADFIAHAPTDLAALLDEVARLAAEVERLRFDYERGHAAGDAARMQRCKQDVARALRLDGVSPPVWGDLVAEVERLNADHAAVLADMGDALAEIGRLSAMVPRWEFGAPSRGELMVGECRIGSVVRMSPGDWSAWATDGDGYPMLLVMDDSGRLVVVSHDSARVNRGS